MSTEVRDRYITAVPTGTHEWLEQLDALTTQVRHGLFDAARLEAAIDRLQAEVTQQARWRMDDRRW